MSREFLNASTGSLASNGPNTLTHIPPPRERMGYSIGFEHVLNNRATEDAFRIIEGWLGDEKASIRSAQPPNRIEATHGRALQPMGWKRDAKKTMTFELVQQGPNVLVR